MEYGTQTTPDRWQLAKIRLDAQLSIQGSSEEAVRIWVLPIPNPMPAPAAARTNEFSLRRLGFIRSTGQTFCLRQGESSPSLEESA
jgi:hypothetical protein